MVLIFQILLRRPMAHVLAILLLPRTLLIVGGGLVVAILETLVSCFTYFILADLTKAFFFLDCFLLADIVACPKYLTWGVSFDDGPSMHSMS